MHCVHLSLGTGSVYGWGNTGVGNNPDTNTCSLATANPNILQETQLRMCTAAESAAQGGQGLVDGQLCAVGTASSPYRVTWQLIKCIKKNSSQGDSGGPLTIKSGDQHVQVGDVSFGEGCPTVPITVGLKLVYTHTRLGNVPHCRVTRLACLAGYPTTEPGWKGRCQGPKPAVMGSILPLCSPGASCIVDDVVGIFRSFQIIFPLHFKIYAHCVLNFSN